MATYTGTSGSDDLDTYYLTGSLYKGAVLIGLGGDDTLEGRRGDDVLYGGAGQDFLVDDDGGADRFYGGAGDDTLIILRYAGPDDPRDPYVPAPTHLVLDGGADDDNVNAIYMVAPDDLRVFGDAVLSGGSGDDSLTTDHIAARIDGGAGNDFIEADHAPAVLDGGPGDDIINVTALAGSADVQGGTGDDHLYVNLASGPIKADGGAGDDLIYVTSGAQDTAATVTGGSGDDSIHGQGVHLLIDGGSGNDVIEATAEASLTVTGGAGADVITAFGAEVTVDAGSGADVVTVSAASGHTAVTLGGGIDRLVLDGVAPNDASAAHVVVTDFRTGNSGDVLDFSTLLATGTTFGQGDAVAQDYVRLVQRGVDTVVQVLLDPPGSGSGSYWHDEVLLQHVAASTLNTHNLDFGLS